MCLHSPLSLDESFVLFVRVYSRHHVVDFYNIVRWYFMCHIVLNMYCCIQFYSDINPFLFCRFHDNRPVSIESNETNRNGWNWNRKKRKRGVRITHFFLSRARFLVLNNNFFWYNEIEYQQTVRMVELKVIFFSCTFFLLFSAHCQRGFFFYNIIDVSWIFVYGLALAKIYCYPCSHVFALVFLF